MLSNWVFTLLPFGLVLLALVLFWVSAALKRHSGLPDGQIILSDHGKWGQPQKPLYDAELGLTGKPDYLIRRKNTLIPVEVKSGWAPAAPYESHKLQLAAYCLLVWRFYGLRPPYGLLRYRNRTFKVDFNDEIEVRLLETLAEIRQRKGQDECLRSHAYPQRCARCGYRMVCDQRL